MQKISITVLFNLIFIDMKEVLDYQTLEEAKGIIASQLDEQVENKNIVTIHCSWCTNCSGIVGD